MEHESEPRIRLERRGHVSYLTIDHQARRNALTFSMWESMPALLRQVQADPQCRLVVLRGAGCAAFAAGSDISQFEELRGTPAGIARYNNTAAEAVACLQAVRIPVVARIKGYCIGAGMALALHCDLRYADDGAVFSIPAGRLAVGYQHLWLQRLSSLVGPAKAKEIMFTSDRYDACAALAMGLVNRICADDEFADAVETICAMAPLTLVAAKTAIDQATRPDGYDRNVCEQAIKACFESADYREGRAAFKEKRRPEFTGR